MTKQQRAAIERLIERQTRLNTVSEGTAREFLIRSEIYTAEGQLSPAFGGPAKSEPSTVRAHQGLRRRR